MGIVEESSNVSAAQWNTGNRKTQKHRYGNLQMAPISDVIASPNGSKSLAASKKRTGQNEGSQFVIGSHQLSSNGSFNLDFEKMLKCRSFLKKYLSTVTYHHHSI